MTQEENRVDELFKKVIADALVATRMDHRRRLVGLFEDPNEAPCLGWVLSSEIKNNLGFAAAFIITENGEVKPVLERDQIVRPN